MNDKKNTRGQSPLKNPLIIFLIISIIATVILNMAITAFSSPSKTSVTYSKFLEMVK